MLVSSLIVTRLDYGNSLLTGCTEQTLDKIDRLLNCSARVIFGNDSRHHVTPLLHNHLHWLRSKSAYWRTRQYTALHHVIWTRGAFQFPLFPTFLVSVLLLVVIWSYAEQGYNSATGHFVWLVRSPVTVYHWTFIRHLHYQRSRHLFSRFYFKWLTVSRVRAAEIVRRPCSDSSHVTEPYKLSFYYYYYYYYMHDYSLDG